jgi:hypothetical protein
MNRNIRMRHGAIYFGNGMFLDGDGEDFMAHEPHGKRDYEGNLVERTKQEHPYNFSDFVRWAKYRNRKASDFKLEEGQSLQNSYSDCMSRWDSDHFNKCFAEHLPIGSGGFRHGSPGNIEKFMRAFQRDEKLELLRIVDSCDCAGGWEIFRFDFIYNAQTEAPKDHPEVASEQ